MDGRVFCEKIHSVNVGVARLDGYCIHTDSVGVLHPADTLRGWDRDKHSSHGRGGA